VGTSDGDPTLRHDNEARAPGGQSPWQHSGWKAVECSRVSWDIFVQDLPAGAKSVADIPEDFVPKSLGPRAELIRKICQVVPDADFSDPSWGLIRAPTFSIEVNIGKEAICDSFAFHVRGGGDGAVGLVAAILSHLGLRAIDAQTGEFFAWGQEALESFRKWKAFRDQVMNDLKN
jgi:hypothetical protein